MTCETCKYWTGRKRAGEVHLWSLGACTRFPPSVFPGGVDAEGPVTLWPVTYAVDDCGEFKPLDEKE